MYKKEIENFIEAHKQEMVEDIFTLCRVNSEKMPYEEGMPYGRGAFEALQHALAMAERYGFQINNYDNFVGTADMNEKEHQLDILAHLDVVPAGEGWTVTKPFEPVEIDGKLYGRGTADDKGPAVAALYAMRAVKELGIPLNKNVRLILGTDEECGSSDIEHYYDIEQEAPMTFSPDASFPVINTEKSHLVGHFTADFEPSKALPKLVSFHAGTKANVVPGKAYAEVAGLEPEDIENICKQVTEETNVVFELEPAFESIKIMAVGNGAHAAHPNDGDNALTALLTLLSRMPFAECEQVRTFNSLIALMPHGDVYGEKLGIAMEDEISGCLTLAFSMLTIDEKSLDGIFDSRCPLCANEDNMLNIVKSKLAEAGMTLQNEHMGNPHHVPGDSLFVKTLLRVYEDYSGRKGECQHMGGGTYVHNLKNGVAFGAALPETNNHMHGADEVAVLDELLLSAKIFAQVIVDLCGERAE